jgi:formylmethanofuran dehydrogenase subunit E
MTEVSKIGRPCPTCTIPLIFTEDDARFNAIRLKEIVELKDPNIAFVFKFRSHCEKCGEVFVEQKIKNVRF